MTILFNKTNWFKEIRLFLVIAGIITFSNTNLYAQGSIKADSKLKNSLLFETSFGYKLFSDKDLVDKYGSGSILPTLALNYYPFNRLSFGIRGEYFHTSKEINSVERNETNTITALPISAFARYNLPILNNDFYFFGELGAGIAIANSRSEGWYLDMHYNEVPFSNEDKRWPLNTYLEIGLEWYIHPKLALSLSTGYSYIPVKDWGLNMSGFSFVIGLKGILFQEAPTPPLPKPISIGIDFVINPGCIINTNEDPFTNELLDEELNKLTQLYQKAGANVEFYTRSIHRVPGNKGELVTNGGKNKSSAEQNKVKDEAIDIVKKDVEEQKKTDPSYVSGEIIVKVIRNFKDPDRTQSSINGIAYPSEKDGIKIIEIADPFGVDQNTGHCEWHQPLAHEVGHIFGLGHSKEENNLMNEEGCSENESLTPDQIKDINKAAKSLKKK
jgi:hypothetical protein